MLIQQDEAFVSCISSTGNRTTLLKLKGKGLLTASEELAEKVEKEKLKLKSIEIYRRIVIYKEKVESHE